MPKPSANFPLTPRRADLKCCHAERVDELYVDHLTLFCGHLQDTLGEKGLWYCCYGCAHVSWLDVLMFTDRTADPIEGFLDILLRREGLNACSASSVRIGRIFNRADEHFAVLISSS